MRAGAFPFSIRSAFPARIGRLSWVGAASTAVGGIPLTTLVLWYLCHIGVWEPLRSVTPWELLMHGMGIERTHPGVWSADVVAFWLLFGYGASLVCGTVPVGARLPCPGCVDRREGAEDSRSATAVRCQ